MSKFQCKKFHGECKAGCCGVVPIPKNVYKRNKKRKNRKVLMLTKIGSCYVPITEDLLCPFLQDDKSCGIYDSRPDVCRRFGSEENIEMSCPWQKKDGSRRSDVDRQRIERIQHEKIKDFMK